MDDRNNNNMNERDDNVYNQSDRFQNAYERPINSSGNFDDNRNMNSSSDNNRYPNYQYQGGFYGDNNQNQRPQQQPIWTTSRPIDAQPVKKMDKGLKIFLWSIVGLLIVFVLGFCIYGIYTVMSSEQNGNPLWQLPLGDSSQSDGNSESNALTNPNGPALQIQSSDATSDSLSAEQVYASASPSIVGVVIYDPKAGIGSDPQGEGSGIVLSEDGYIVTNSHVVGDSKQYSVKVVKSDGTEYAASVVGYDTRTDLAVVKAEASGLTPATFGNSDQLSVGAWVSAIGNPGGLDFSNSMTRGIVSAVNRQMNTSQIGYIQTDAAINPGNSGGALLNMYGQVIGINTSKIVATGYEGMGFAIPINAAKPVIDDLIKQGYVSGRVRLGMTGKVVSQYQSYMFHVPQGIMIAQISQESDLLAQGVVEGEIITKVNDVEVTSFNELYAELTKCSPGDKVKLTIYNQESRRSRDVSVKVIEDKGETQK